MSRPDDPAPGTVPVTDHRTAPSGVLPRRLQTWIMVGVAAVMLLIILLAGQPRPPAAPPATTRPAAPASADRVREYQDRLRAMEARAALEAAATAPDPPAAGRSDVASGPRAEDPTVAERRRREFDSLFASNVVLSRRPEGLRPQEAASAPASPPEALASAPSLEAVADAVVRASARQVPPAQQAPSPADVGRAATPPTSGSAPVRPADTPPIEATGPLHRLLEGTFIDAVLTNRLDGSDAAPVVSLVTQPVFAHAGHVVVIPAGARVLGETRPVRTLGETRLAVAFHRLVMPDGRSYGLDRVQGLNPRGDAGLRDQVNAHYWATFGAAGAVGLISGLSQWLGTAGFSHSDGDQTVVIGGAVANTTAQTSVQVMNRFLNRLPTITIREGHRLKVYLSRDLELPAYGAAGPLTLSAKE